MPDIERGTTRPDRTTHPYLKDPMHPLMLVGLSLLVPFFWLVLLWGLAWLEDTLTEDVKKAERRGVPKPVRAIPKADRPKA
jgi:hypothetical protein